MLGIRIATALLWVWIITLFIFHPLVSGTVTHWYAHFAISAEEAHLDAALVMALLWVVTIILTGIGTCIVCDDIF